MIIVVSEQLKKDINGKQYKYFTLFTPEQIVQETRKHYTVMVKAKPKRCGYIAYATGYNNNQDPDPMYFMSVGDIVDGEIVTKQVEPYIINNELITTCTVPVFCSREDPIEFEIAIENAIKRAGKTLDTGQRLFGEPDKLNNVPVEIPDNCLVVLIVNNN